MGDRKNYVIVILILVVVALGVYIGISKYNQNQATVRQAYYQQGLKDGQLYEQRNVILQLQNSGFYSLNFLDEKNETQTIRLGVMQPPQVQQQSSSGITGR